MKKEEIIKEIEKINREVILLREEFNRLKEYHLAGELSAIGIILDELKRYLEETF